MNFLYYSVFAALVYAFPCTTLAFIATNYIYNNPSDTNILLTTMLTYSYFYSFSALLTLLMYYFVLCCVFKYDNIEMSIAFIYNTFRIYNIKLKINDYDNDLSHMFDKIINFGKYIENKKNYIGINFDAFKRNYYVGQVLSLNNVLYDSVQNLFFSNDKKHIDVLNSIYRHDGNDNHKNKHDEIKHLEEILNACLKTMDHESID